MKRKHGILLAMLIAIAAALAISVSTARADVASDHQLAGILGTGEVYVTGEPGYEELMWHHVTPAELATITKTGMGFFDTTWFVGSDASVLPGTIHIDSLPAPALVSDHQLAGVISTGQVYVTGEPGYAEGVWTPVTPTELATVTATGAGLFDIAWYGDHLPGTLSTELAP